MRDGQQSLFATRMSQQTIDRLLPLYENAGFYIMEVWGGAVPDSVMRYRPGIASARPARL